MIAGVTAPPTALPWLLAGPSTSSPESLASHLARLDACPIGEPDLIGILASADLRGRGGARFPTWRKWKAVAGASRGDAVIVVNGAEGEPASQKDRVLMGMRPHLVLDGAALAAQAVGAGEIVLYVSRAFPEAARALDAALRERRREQWQRPGRVRPPRFRLVSAPPRYVAGEETAAVGFINRGEAKPRAVPPRPFERGVSDRPTLVQNVETMALVALLARFGAPWFRSVGTAGSPGPMLLTVSGEVARPGVYEVAHGTRPSQVIALAGGNADCAAGILLGGYFGTWVPPHRARELILDDAAMSRAGVTIGAGVVYVLPGGTCGVAATAGILRYLAGESARQCGPCQHGLSALAQRVDLLTAGRHDPTDIDRLRRWCGQLARDRGACKHPDGAVGLLSSAMETFAAEFDRHWRSGPCPDVHRPAGLPLSPVAVTWR